MPNFVCVTECFHENRVWTPGDGKILTADKQPNEHFAEINVNNEVDAEEVKRHQIRAVLKSLDTKNDENWGKDGKPAMKAINEALGFEVTRKEVEAAFPNFNREVIGFGNAKSDFMN